MDTAHKPPEAGAKAPPAARSVGIDGVDALFRQLAANGYRLVGPTIRDGVVVLDEIPDIGALPRGWVDEQQPGRYRLRRDGDALFGCLPGPQGPKRWLHVPRQTLWRTEGSGATIRIVAQAPDHTPLALIGLRACELEAIRIQDRVLAGGESADPHYAARRAGVFVVAVECGRAGETCFCTAVGSGPEVRAGFDVALTEIATGAQARFVVRAGSERGAALAAALPGRDATADDLAAARALTDQARAQVGRSLPMDGLAERLTANAEHPRWDEIAGRCLACANCTLVCPTCFCTTTEDSSTIGDDATQRERRWDSCFTSRSPTCTAARSGAARLSATGSG
ncbi:MAG: 4Fe-4S dicluster domain-containing protein [Burkholderiaceae bacterium]